MQKLVQGLRTAQAHSRQQLRYESAFSQFKKSVQKELDSNPELKKSLDGLKEKADAAGEAARERSKEASGVYSKAAESASSTAASWWAKASETTSALRDQATKTTSAASQAVKESYDDLKASAASQAKADGKSEAGASPAQESAADIQSAEQSQQQQQPSAGTSSREEPPGGPGFAASSADASSSGEQTGQGSDSSQQEERRSSSAGSSTSGAASASFMSRISNLASVVRREVSEAILPRSQQESLTRARPASLRQAATGDAPSAVAVVQQPVSAWRQYVADMQDKLGMHPFFRRLSGLRQNKVFDKAGDVAEDMRQRWETSDSPLVLRLQNMSDSVFTETEMAQALKEIRMRQPGFDMVLFLRSLKTDVPTIIKAYLLGDLPALKEHCSKQLMERFSGIIAAQQKEGIVSDATMLDWSDVELVDLKMLEGDPAIIVQFTCQQINCSRDKFGNVVEGAPDSVQRVFYLWALQQEEAGFVGSDGKHYPPRWQLAEMMVRGMHNLL